MTFETMWFRRRPEKGATWACRVRWTAWDGNHPQQCQKTLETPHRRLKDALAYPPVVEALELVAGDGEHGPPILVSEDCPPGTVVLIDPKTGEHVIGVDLGLAAGPDNPQRD